MGIISAWCRWYSIFPGCIRYLGLVSQMAMGGIATVNIYICEVISNPMWSFMVEPYLKFVGVTVIRLEVENRLVVCDF